MTPIAFAKHFILIAALGMSMAACEDDAAIRVVGELSSDRVEIVVESNEAIVDLPIREGSAVSRDQVLMQQFSARSSARHDEAAAVLAEAEARLAELVRGPRSEQIAAARANVNGANKEVRFRDSEQQRILALHAKNLASTEARDTAIAALDAANSTLEVQRARLQEHLAGTTIEELNQAEAVANQARARLRIASIDLQQLTLRAPQDGILDSRLFEIGERPRVGETALVLLGGEQVHARVFVPEQLRASIREGSPATLYVDGIAEPIAGRVRWIANEPAFTPYYALTEHDRGRLSYVAKIDIDERRARLPDGLPVEVEFALD